jgi:hypothetical protein
MMSDNACQITNPMFVEPDPEAPTSIKYRQDGPEPCEHPWDAVHYITEGFDVMHCARCQTVIGITPAVEVEP